MSCVFEHLYELDNDLCGCENTGTCHSKKFVFSSCYGCVVSVCLGWLCAAQAESKVFPLPIEDTWYKEVRHRRREGKVKQSGARVEVLLFLVWKVDCVLADNRCALGFSGSGFGLWDCVCVIV